jgi:hypothetical protein
VGKRVEMKSPSNKQHFQKLVPFAKEIMILLKKNKISSVIYGSYAHFYYTQDETMKVNDLDIMIPNSEKNFPRIVEILKDSEIKFKYFPKWETLIIKKGKLKVEIDSVGLEYKSSKDKTILKTTKKINFYGIRVNMITLKQLEEIYLVAYGRSIEDKAKILKKIKRLERFLKRKLKT